MRSLAITYRPKEFEEVSSQKATIKILKRQIELNQIVNCYLFCGPSGTGKTTLARIFANKINNGEGNPIEIDGASNNGVDNVKAIIDDAKEHSIDSTYKVIIIDECHMITTQGWNAFLKCIEEPPKYTIFIFCTTNPEKIPTTILNRVMRFNLTKIGTNEIKERLRYVCQNEGFTNYEDAIDYISKLANGGMRDALAMLDKCSGYSNDLNINDVLTTLGVFSYDTMFDLTNNIIDGNETAIITQVNGMYDSGVDLKHFIDNYLNFVFDLDKFCLFGDISITTIPSSFVEKVKYTTGIESNIKFFNWLVDKILEIKELIKYDTNINTTISIKLLQCARGQ